MASLSRLQAPQAPKLDRPATPIASDQSGRSRLFKALWIGALGGAAGPAIGWAGGKVAQAISARNLPVPAALQGVPSKVVDWMQRGIGTATPEDMQAAADKLGPQGFFGEQTPGLLDLSQSVATNGGQGKGAIRGAYDARFDGANDRIMAGVDKALGPVQDAGAVRQATQDAGAAASAPYFARAAASGQAWDPTLESLSQRPGVTSAMGDVGGQPRRAVVDHHTRRLRPCQRNRDRHSLRHDAGRGPRPSRHAGEHAVGR